MRGQKNTVRINPVITQSEFEHDMKDILKHGVIKQLAEYLGVSHTLLVQQFNPDDERISWIFRALSVQVALDEIDPEAGAKLYNLYALYRERGKGRDEDEIAADNQRTLLNKTGDCASLKAFREVQ